MDIADLIKKKMKEAVKDKGATLIVAKKMSSGDEALNDAIKDFIAAVKDENVEDAVSSFKAAHAICCDSEEAEEPEDDKEE